VLLGLLLHALITAPATPHDEAIVVSAAISLTDALQEIEKAYVAQGGTPVRFNFAASNVLARQIANGAPADIFISADLVQMDHAEQAGAIDRATRGYLLTNRLAIVTPRGGARIADGKGLLAREVRRIAIGDPTAVPAGAYAKYFLQHEGLWEALQRKLLPLANVRAALAAVESGSADAAFVYETDAAASKGVDLSYIVPPTAVPPIVYPAAITTRCRNRAAAERFLAFLRGPEARKTFERFKFGVYVTVAGPSAIPQPRFASGVTRRLDDSTTRRSLKGVAFERRRAVVSSCRRAAPKASAFARARVTVSAAEVEHPRLSVESA
jgi:molybdate transport system substrate-binding protein